MEALDRKTMAQLFTEARTFSHWQDRPVSQAQLQELYELARWAPTSMNCGPMRLLFLMSDEARERLEPALAAGNVAQTLSAPVTAIVATDYGFYEHLPRLFPVFDGARELYANDPELAAETAFRNASMQGGYLIMAARAMGLDCGPMSGFDAGKVDETFFPGTRIRTNFLLNLGYGDRTQLHPRGPRLTFREVARVL